MPRVSIVMPLFNGIKYIKESLQSVQSQTYQDWEFIIINDYESNDGCAKIVNDYAKKDNRIKLIQAEKRLGLARSLNLGLDLAEGEYIARVDVDDPSMPRRLEKQVEFMDTHPELVMCSCWQKVITKNESYVLKVATEFEDLKASMIFGCEISHCGVMLRTAEMNKHGWRYDPNYYGEDYELWLRILSEGGRFENIPEALVCHRWGYENISLVKADDIRSELCELCKRTLNTLGVNTDKYHQLLFSGWRSMPHTYAINHYEQFLKQGYCLLEEITACNQEKHLYEEEALKKVLWMRWNWIRKTCCLKFKELGYDELREKLSVYTPMVSVIIPTLNSARDLSSAIDSVYAQTYTEWELLVINDYGSDDGTAEIVKMYEQIDPRVHLLQAESRLGLAESLNWGIREAKGKYIARLDADDTAYETRFEKQLALMEQELDVGICGTWQRHYGSSSNWIHAATEDEKMLKCRFIFWCDLCHSTLMLRKETLLQNELFYNPNACAEDYELWTRAMFVTRIVNIPEVLGDYKEDGTGITYSKKKELKTESGELAGTVLENALNIHLSKYQCSLLSGWSNQFTNALNRDAILKELKSVLYTIWNENERIQFFDSDALLQTLAAKWHWAKDGVDWKRERCNVKTIEEALSDKSGTANINRIKSFFANNPSHAERARKMAKCVLRPAVRACRWVLQKLFSKIVGEIKSSVESWTWERYERTEILLDKRQKSEIDYLPYYPGTKIRVVFLFQVASFWVAQESLYFKMIEDERFDVRLVCYDEPIDRTIKVETSREYLIRNKYDYVPWESFDIDEFNPHVVFLQTPYDQNRRVAYKSTSLYNKGYRVAYIPYGLEIADTEHAHIDHFRQPIVRCAWKIYTFSPRMKEDYLRHIQYRTCIEAMGLPRFDALYNKDRFPQHKRVLNMARGRTVILWKVHFPKVIKESGKRIYVTPDMCEYISFARALEQYKGDFFFVFMPHPRFREYNEDSVVQKNLQTLMQIVDSQENVFVDDADDYRNSLLNAEAIIVDRSAVMVEAAVVGVPILYMHNGDYDEPITEALRPLINSYYQGSNYQDMIAFIEQLRRREDPQKARRMDAFEKTMPFFDGHCSQRIADNIAQTIYRANAENDESQCNSFVESERKGVPTDMMAVELRTVLDNQRELQDDIVEIQQEVNALKEVLMRNKEETSATASGCGITRCGFQKVNMKES